RDLDLAPRAGCVIDARVGYGTDLPPGDVDLARQAWLQELVGIDAWAMPADWMRDECRWALGQFLSFTVFDGSVGQPIVDLGGYGWRGFNQREVGENAMGLSVSNPRRAEVHLRWLASRAWPNGDHPAGCNFRPIAGEQPAQPESSDTELWFLLAVGVHCLEQGHEAILDEPIPGLDGQPISLWEHALRSWRFLVEDIGLGAHGLVRSWRGDWNDYLFPMGRAGHGESVKNSGMACRAGTMLAALARNRGDAERAARIEAWVTALRASVAAAWTGSHFLRGYTDAGRPVGDDRVFINAQSWPVLGGCGSVTQRQTALRHTLEHNATDLGLCLVNPPFPSPPPADVSSLPIPPGEGENGGVWPQAVAWFIWALADAHMSTEALDLWRRNTLRHHYATFPETPFGIWNGPDCYNSHLAGQRAHWTQTQLWDRRVYNPMNPSVAWQVFGMQRILACQPLAEARHG
ncbi:MAG: GH36-type glycosyl hydrolase domain-containing protein, partial [Planctomycetota bacterium]